MCLRYRAVQCRSQVTGGHCMHGHTCAHLCSLEDTPRLAQSFCVCLRPSSASWERIQVLCAKKSLYPYNKAILIRHRSGQGTCGTCSSAWKQRFASRPWAWSPGHGPAAVAVTPKDSSALCVLASRNQVKVPVQIAACPALLQAGQLSGGQGLGGRGSLP